MKGRIPRHIALVRPRFLKGAGRRKRPPRTSRGAFLRALALRQSRMQKPFRPCSRKGRSLGTHTADSAASGQSGNGFLFSRRRSRQAARITTAHGLHQAFSKEIAALIACRCQRLPSGWVMPRFLRKKPALMRHSSRKKLILLAGTAQGLK